MDSTTHLHLTRRGRVVVLATLVALVLLAFLLGRSGTSLAATHTAAPRPYAQTVVQPGETLWAVAHRVAPGHDPRAVIEQIQQLNHLSDGALQAGQQLLLPHSA